MGIPVFVLGAALAYGKWRDAKRTTQNFRFSLPVAPAFLTESLAMDRAKAALAVDGYHIDSWVAEEDNRTQAPDGTADVFLFRSDPKSGTIRFHKKEEWAAGKVVQRLVWIELLGDSIVCRIIKPK